jgi:hypothetical protein
MANPKIVYTPTGGTEQTLDFSAPPRQQPGYSKTAVRHDNISTAGIRESVLERIDTFLEFTVDYIRPGTDLTSWSGFLDYALTGGPFDYYPDALQSGSTSCLLENTDAQIQYKAAGIYSLALKLRAVVI